MLRELPFDRKMKQVIFFPHNGNSLEAICCLNKTQKLLGFIDDDKQKQGTTSYEYKIFSRKIINISKKAKILAVPGSPSTYKERRKIIDSLEIHPERYISLIHPRAFVSPLAKIGYNVLIMAGVIVTSNAVIGNNVCVLPNSVIHHDVKIGDYTLIGSNVTIAGRVTIGENCYIGSASSIINDIEIEDNVMVGMAANVIRNVKKNSRVVGNPARCI